MLPFLSHIATLCLLAIPLLFGCGREEKMDIPRSGNNSQEHTQAVPAFSGRRAFDYLERQVGFGPRNPNSSGHRQCGEYLLGVLRGFADTLTVQQFEQPGYDRKPLRLMNIVASFKPDASDRILLCAHWDTRPRAERDPNPDRWNEPIPGANDGASGVAVLLEIASLLKSSPPPIGVDIVLFDGEDYGHEGDTPNYLLGSRYFARTRPADYIPRFGILLDMVGDTRLELPREGSSVYYAPDIVDMVWGKAASLGFTQFLGEVGPAVMDDHVPLNEAGIRTIDIIDFSYPDESHEYWHTHEDTPDKCSPESLEAVGTVVTHIVYGQVP